MLFENETKQNKKKREKVNELTPFKQFKLVNNNSHKDF